jgi:transposase
MKQKQEKRIRRKFFAEEKATILRRHFVDQVPVSDLCEENRIQPSLFYVWQRQMWENLGVALENGKRKQLSAKEESLGNRVKILEDILAQKEAKLAKKDRIIAEVTAEYVQLKNELGEL